MRLCMFSNLYDNLDIRRFLDHLNNAEPLEEQYHLSQILLDSINYSFLKYYRNIDYIDYDFNEFMQEYRKFDLELLYFMYEVKRLYSLYNERPVSENDVTYLIFVIDDIYAHIKENYGNFTLHFDMYIPTMLN